MATLEKNIKDDYGAAGNGSTDDWGAFNDFKTAVLTWQASNVGLVTLTVPAGTYHIPTQPTAPTAQFIFKGIKQLKVVGESSEEGASLSYLNGDMFLGGFGLPNATVSGVTQQCGIESVSAGVRSVVLTNAAKHSLYVVGRMGLVSGFDIGPVGGFPPSPHFFQYVRFIGKDAAAGIIYFDRPLRYDFLSTWPNYDSGNAFSPYGGGPATLYPMDESWDGEREFVNLKFNRANNQITCHVRKAVFVNCRTPTGTSIIPSENEIFMEINHTDPEIKEVDKIIEHYITIGGTRAGFDYQSSSVNSHIAKDLTLTSFIHGTAKQTLYDTCTIGSLAMGPFSYGRADSIVVRDSTVTAPSVLSILHKGPNDAGVENTYSMAAGVITVPKTAGEGLVPWAVPGTRLLWQASSDNRPEITNDAIQVTAVTYDATNVYVHTTGTVFPDPDVEGFPIKVYIRVHPAPRLTFTNVIGSATSIALSAKTPGNPLGVNNKDLNCPIAANTTHGFDVDDTEPTYKAMAGVF